MSDTQTLESQFRESVEAKNFSGLEKLWMTTIEADGGELPSVEVFVEAADAFLGASEIERAQVLLDLTVPLFEEKLEPARFLKLLRRSCLASPDNSELRQRFVRCFRDVYGATSAETVFLDLAEVEKSNVPLKKALQQLEQWMRFRVGCYVHHSSGWGTGQVREVDPLLRRATVQLEKKPNHSMDVEAMAAVLEPLGDDHFLALIYQGGDRLREMRDDDPVALIGNVLDSFQNPMRLRDIKEKLIPQVIANDAWTRWWGKAKKALRQSGFYRVGDRAPYHIEKLAEAVSYDDELIARYRAGSWSQRRDLARRSLKTGANKLPKLLEIVLDELREKVGAAGVEAIEARCLITKIAGSSSDESLPTLTAMLESTADPVAVILELDGADDQRAGVAELPGVLGDAFVDASVTLLRKGNDPIRDAVFQEVKGDALTERVGAEFKTVLASPRPAPALFAWIVRKALSGHESPLIPPTEEVLTLEYLDCVFDLMDQFAMRAERERSGDNLVLVGSLRSLVSHESNRLFDTVIRSVNKREGRRLYERVLASSGLTPDLRIRLLDTLAKTMPEVMRPVDDKPIWEQDTIYVTQTGLNKREDELRDLRENQLPEVFKEIGRAAAFGDLSENAEYTAAIEKRDFLTQRASAIQDELEKVHLITPAHIKEGEVTLGAKVSLLDLDTQTNYDYSILGPWDGDPDDGIISYKSPLGRTFLGAAPGAEVACELPSGVRRFKILGVESAL